MTNVPTYDTPPRHRAALEQRIRNICRALNANEFRTRTSLAHTVVAQLLPDGVVKGGAAIMFRVGDHASRLTTDLDTARASHHTIDTYTTELADHLAHGWHGFTGRLVTRDPAEPPGVPDDYVMHPFDIKLAYAGQSYVTVQLELGHDEIGSTNDPTFTVDTDTTDLLTRLGFPAPDPVPVLAVEHQIAQKLHACTTPDRNGNNERAHDLVDLQVLITADPPDLTLLDEIGQRLFTSRRTTTWPPTVAAYPGWDDAYRAAAEGLDVLPLDDAITWANTLITRPRPR